MTPREPVNCTKEYKEADERKKQVLKEADKVAKSQAADVSEVRRKPHRARLHGLSP